MIFLSAAYYPDTSLMLALLESAKEVGADLRLFGFQTPYEGFIKSKLLGLRAYLDTIPEHEVVAYVDSADTVLARSPMAIETAYHAVVGDAYMLMSAERTYFPKQGFRSHFTRLAAPHWAFRFPCAGAFMGRCDYLKSAIDTLVKHVIELSPNAQEDDQGLWHLGLVTGLVSYKIDYACRAMISTKHIRPFWYSASKYGLNLTVEHGKPGIIHVNGTSKRRFRISRMFRRIYGRNPWQSPLSPF